MSSAPDIVLLLADQLSAKWLEAAAAGVCPMPHLERLRAREVEFTRAFTSNPVCCPARASLATGLTCRQHGVLRNGLGLDPALPTFMRLLQAAGWRSGAFGKVHLPGPARFHPGEAYEEAEPDYRRFGFDEQAVSEDPRRGAWLRWVAAEHPRHLRAALATAWPFAVGADDAQAAAVLAARQGFSFAHPACPTGDASFHALPFPEPVSQTAWITGRALEFIAGVPAGRPLLAHLGWVQPHSPWSPPAECLDRVDAARIPAPLPPTWAGDPGHPRHFDRSRAVAREIPADWRERRRCYFADLAHLDAQLGRVLDGLEAAGRLDRAWIILSADHGELLLDHGCREKEAKHYDACIRVPLLIAGPGAAAGRRVAAPVQLEDLAPTILDLCGVPYPLPRLAPGETRPPPPGLPGRSLRPWLEGGEPSAWRSHAYVESFSRAEPGEEHHWSGDPRHWARSVRDARWRYTWYPCGGGEQLFDLDADPGELRNLAAEPACAAERERLRGLLLESVVLQDWPQIERHPRS